MLAQLAASSLAAQAQPLVQGAFAAAAVHAASSGRSWVRQLSQLQQARSCMTHQKLRAAKDADSASNEEHAASMPGPAADMPVVHSDENKASGGEPPHSPYMGAFDGLKQHGEPHNILFSDDHANITNEVEKLLQVADELGGSQAVFKVVEQFGDGAGWSEMNVATTFSCLGREAAAMDPKEVDRQILQHPCFERLVGMASRQAVNMSDVELAEVARACASLGYDGMELLEQVTCFELNNLGALGDKGCEPDSTAESISGAG